LAWSWSVSAKNKMEALKVAQTSSLLGLQKQAGSLRYF
jgi:hypothetical protein